MPNWVSVVVVIIVFLAAGLLYESWRMRDLEGVASRRGLALHRPFSPVEGSQLQRLAKRLDGRQGSSRPRWGAGLTGMVDGIEITIGEYEMPNRNSSNSNGEWFVIMAWRGSSATAEAGAGDALPQGRSLDGSGQVIREADWAAWRVEGNVTSAKVDELLAQWSETRRQF